MPSLPRTIVFLLNMTDTMLRSKIFKYYFIVIVPFLQSATTVTARTAPNTQLTENNRGWGTKECRADVTCFWLELHKDFPCRPLRENEMERT